MLATNAFPPLLRRIGAYVVPVYDYVLMTEPLTAEQRAAIGWRGRQGLADCTNQFHYYRLTADGRILWGGYDAIYHFRNGFGPSYEQRAATHELLARHFFDTFPQLEGPALQPPLGRRDRHLQPLLRLLRHGARRRARTPPATPGSASAPRGSARACARPARRPRDRGAPGCARALEAGAVPARAAALAGVTLTRDALARADRRQGGAGLWLRALDRLGLGFDS